MKTNEQLLQEAMQNIFPDVQQQDTEVRTYESRFAKEYLRLYIAEHDLYSGEQIMNSLKEMKMNKTDISRFMSLLIINS